MAHLRKDATTGHLTKISSSGRLSRFCDCTCGEGDLPSSITIDLTNWDQSGCTSRDSCSPDGSATIVIPRVSGKCEYRKEYGDFSGGYHCWTGRKINQVILYWVKVVRCYWWLDVGYGGLTSFRGSTDPTNPLGIYVITDSPSCATGTIEVK